MRGLPVPEPLHDQPHKPHREEPPRRQLHVSQMPESVQVAARHQDAHLQAARRRPAALHHLRPHARVQEAPQDALQH